MTCQSLIDAPMKSSALTYTFYTIFWSDTYSSFKITRREKKFDSRKKWPSAFSPSLRAIPCKYQKYVGTHSNRFDWNHEIRQEAQKLCIESAFRFFIILLVSMETASKVVIFEILRKTRYPSSCTQCIKTLWSSQWIWYIIYIG